MKLVLLFVFLSFGILQAQEVNLADPNLQIGMNATFESDVADVTQNHQYAQKSFGTVPSANCPACAFAQQLGAHEMNAVELGAVPGTYGAEKVNSSTANDEQK